MTSPAIPCPHHQLSHGHLLLAVVVVVGVAREALCYSPLWDSVTTRVQQEYEVWDGRDRLTVRMTLQEVDDPANTDLVVGEEIRRDSRIILTCTALHGPAQWVYSGDGSPRFWTNSTRETDGGDLGGEKRYVATLTLGLQGLSANDTGRYNCLTASRETGMRFKTLSAYFHVYVPEGERLFLRRHSERITFDLSQSAARIPCGVTNPRASVTLQKVVRGKLEFVSVGDSVLFHPISGFYPKSDIPGTYICTAALDGQFDSIQFTLQPKTAGEKGAPARGGVASNPPKGTRPGPALKFTRPKGTPPAATPSPPPRQPYIPFHLRYSTTSTYPPFQTFFDVQRKPTKKISTAGRPNGRPGFNASSYPEELLRPSRPPERIPTHRPRPPYQNPFTSRVESESSTIPSHLISYRPSYHHKQQQEEEKEKSTSGYFGYVPASKGPPTPQSPRPISPLAEYRATTGGPTRAPRPRPPPPPGGIPAQLLCAELRCGELAECFVQRVYRPRVGQSREEPACRCTQGHVGNPYLRCHPPVHPSPPPDLLLFNIAKRAGGSAHLSPEGGSASLEAPRMDGGTIPAILDM